MMKSEFDTAQMRKTTIFQRLLAMMLGLLMVFSLCGTELVSVALGEENTQQETLTETREETKSRLMQQIMYESWDPYSADMTLDEFYALMELFDEGKLPINSAARPILKAPGMKEASMEENVNEKTNVIPRTLFMFSGLPTKKEDGSPFAYEDGDAPIAYDNNTGYADDLVNYPKGLDEYGLGYQVPPTSWGGVQLPNGKSQVIIASEGQNDSNNSVSGNVVQSLFMDYSRYGYYVRRVTAENNEATVLGAIKLPGQDKYVYYYLTDEKQSTDVSTTMLADGKKFIIEYYSSEHLVEYEVHMDDIDGEDIKDTIETVNVLGTDMTDTWENIVFGTNHPDKTDNSAYSFTAYAPYGYMVELYIVKTRAEEPGAGNSEDSEWGDPIPLLSKEQDENKQDTRGTFKQVNGGWALGMEPDYLNGTADKATIVPNTKNAPPTLTVSGSIYNNDVHHDRKLIAVVHKKKDPTFLVAPLKHNTNNVSDRGTSAITTIKAKNKQTGVTEEIPYDYEDVYLWVTGGKSKYDYTDSSYGGASKDNLKAGNIATNDGWQWQGKGPYNSTVNMNKEDDGTYSYQWTFQTNNTSGGYTLDALEINGVAVTIPFFSKESVVNDFKKGTSWYTEADIGNGIHIKVEFLMIFNGNPPQRVYRITATGARSNVTISAMNLIMGTGAPEFVAYQLTGVTNGTGLSVIEYYRKKNDWSNAIQGTVYVDDSNTNDGLNTDGDNAHYGANFRFKLADGYASPYYLWESTRSGVIEEQASAERDADGNVILSNLNPVIPLEEAGSVIGSQNIYGPDNEGWYYIRVTTQKDHKVALLTIGTKLVRYVVRYMPGTIDDTGRVPTDMPTFDHTNEPGFDILSQYAEQYDTANGSYYDVTVDTIVRLPDATPSDPASAYKFKDWVLVNINGEPVTDDNGNEFHYRVTHVNLIDVVDYAVPNDNLGGDAADIYVLRLMPCWDKVQYPLHYNIALNWVDAQGKLHEDYFDENWKEVLTDWNIDENGNLTIQVLQNSTPFLDWIAQNPTYIFWDEVNTNNALYQYYEEHDIKTSNATEEEKKAAYDAMEAEMDKAIRTYLPSLTAEGMQDQFDKVLKALCTRDVSGIGADGKPVKSGEKNEKEDFWRLGNYAYQVFEDYATIVVWMREEKGALAFRKSVQEEALIPDDEFYFAVNQVTTVFGTTLNGTYKAYPEKVYDADGNERNRTDRDAWLITFESGNVTSIVKNNGSKVSTTYFTLKNGEGIELYVPAGEYTVTEVGSKSGGTYRVEVTYDGKSHVPTLSSGWMLSDINGSSILKGSEKEFCTHNGVHALHSNTSQVSASVRFELGQENMVHTLQFTNKTTALSIEKRVDAADENQKALQKWLDENKDKKFRFKVTLTLPKEYEPLTEIIDNNVYYYFRMNIYNASNDKAIGQEKLYVNETETDSNIWVGEIDLYAGQRAAVVMDAPDDGKTLYTSYTEGPGSEIVVVPITSPDKITTLPDSTTPVYAEEVTMADDTKGHPRLFYLSDENANPDDTSKWVYIDSTDQIRTEKRYIGVPTISHEEGKLYYKIGNSYVPLPTLLSEVNLKLAIADHVFQVCEEADVPLYSKDGSGEYQPINQFIDLDELVKKASPIYCKVGDDYYEVTLTKVEDDKKGDDGYTYDGVYDGIYEEKIMQMLKINFPVYYSSDGTGYSPVLSLNNIQINVDSINVPVYNAVIEYEFEELWSDKQDKKNFDELWVGQSGITKTGTRTDAVIVNWYKNLPGDGYLAITQNGGKSNESFLYRITNVKSGESLIVSVKGDGVTYVYAPYGEYTIEEITDWAWRYEDGKCVVPNTGKTIATVTINEKNKTMQNAVHADYTNQRNDKVWLGGENSKNNHFDAPSTADENQSADSSKTEYAMLAASFYDEKKKLSEDDNL